MGTIVRYRDVKIIIRTRDHAPPHVHALRGDAKAKIEIVGQKIHYSLGFSRNDLRRLIEFIARNEELLLEAWNEIYQEE